MRRSAKGTGAGFWEFRLYPVALTRHYNRAGAPSHGLGAAPLQRPLQPRAASEPSQRVPACPPALDPSYKVRTATSAPLHATQRRTRNGGRSACGGINPRHAVRVVSIRGFALNDGGPLAAGLMHSDPCSPPDDSRRADMGCPGRTPRVDAAACGGAYRHAARDQATLWQRRPVGCVAMALEWSASNAVPMQFQRSVVHV